VTAPAFNKEIKLEMIPVKAISVVWVQSQRPYREKFAKTIAADFDSEMFGNLIVTLPNGQGIYHAVDGQHRRAGVEIKFGPNEPVPCQVVQCTDPARAAILFDRINSGRLAVHPINTFLVRRTGKYLTECEVFKIVTGCGYRIEFGTADKQIGCVEALKYVYTRYTGKVLEDALHVISATFGTDHQAVVASFVRAYGEFLSIYGGKVNHGKLKEAIKKKFTPGTLSAAAKTHRESHGGSTVEAIISVLKAQYNHNVPKAKRL